jgi:hypothetical protein
LAENSFAAVVTITHVSTVRLLAALPDHDGGEPWGAVLAFGGLLGLLALRPRAAKARQRGPAQAAEEDAEHDARLDLLPHVNAQGAAQVADDRAGR